MRVIFSELTARCGKYLREWRNITARYGKYFRGTANIFVTRVILRETRTIFLLNGIYLCLVLCVASPGQPCGCVVLCINMSAVHNIDNSLEVSTHSTDSSNSIHGDLLLVTVSGGLDSRYTDRSISSVSAVLVHYIHYIPLPSFISSSRQRWSPVSSAVQSRPVCSTDQYTDIQTSCRPRDEWAWLVWVVVSVGGRRHAAVRAWNEPSRRLKFSYH